jgi:hypothetical protein
MEDGATRRMHLEKVSQVLGQPVPELTTADEVPPECNYVLEMFFELSRTRSFYNGPSSISFTEITNYCNLNQIQLESFELDIITHADRCYIEEVSNLSKAKSAP